MKNFDIYFTYEDDSEDMIVCIATTQHDTTKGANRIWLRYKCGTNLQRAALHKLISTEFGERLRFIRQQAYEAGWRDAKAKKRKRSIFITTLGSDQVGF
jgi:hypothetical protein